MKIIKTLLIIALPAIGFSQLVNNGGTITIQNGATLVVESDVENKLNGTIDIQGTGSLEVKGDLKINAGTTFTTSSTSNVKFYGAGDSHVMSNGASISNLTMDKSSSDLILDDAAVVNNNIDFNSADNKIVLGNHDMTLAAVATVTNAGTGKYIQADGSGQLTKKYTADGVKNFEIGDVSNYSPIEINTTATTMGANASVAASVTNAKHASIDGSVTDFITRYWDVFASDMTGFSAATTGTYVASDENGTVSEIGGASWNTSAWSQTSASGNVGNKTVSVTINEDDVDVTGFTLASLELLMNIKTYLQGPYSGSNMADGLRTASVIPLTEPYTALGYSHVGGGAESIVASVLNNAANSDNDIVDWVVVELRDKDDNTDIVASKSALIQRDGDIVDLDGTSALSITDPNSEGSWFISVRHRNHLGFMSNAARTLTSTASAHDFTNGTIATYGTNALKNDGGVYKMWAGDADGNGLIKYAGSGTDINLISTSVFTNPANTLFSPSFPFVGYDRADVDLSGSVIYAGSGTDINVISTSVFTNPANTLFSPTFPVTQQLP